MVVALVALFLVPSLLSGQVEIRSRASQITLTGRVHTQWNSTSVGSENLTSVFLIRRARLTAQIKLNDLVSGKVQPDFGAGKITLKDAYFRLGFSPSFRMTIGQFKRPFDLFELTSSTQILVVERAGGIRGVSTCAGPGGICSLSRFTEKLGFSDRDIGVMFDGRPSEQFRYMASIANGTGANKAEENSAKSFTGRVEFTPLTDLRLSANLGLHDYPNATTATDETAAAYGADVEWGNFSSGLHLQAGVVAGDNWKNLDAAGDPSSFLTAQLIASFRQPVTSQWIEAIEPVFRVSWGDPNTDLDDDEGLLFTTGAAFFFTGRNKIAANIDIWSPTTGNTEYSLKLQSYIHF